MANGIKLKKIKINIKTISPLHIGGKSDHLSGIHNPITKMDNRAVIPGPSFKGAFRSSLEKILITNYIEKEKEMKPCIPTNKLSPDERNLVNKGLYRNDFCQYKKYKYGDKEAPTICPACYLLGAQSLDGFIFIPFFEIEEGPYPQEFYSIRLDRILGTGVNGSNREYEFVPEGVIFAGNMEVTTQNNFRGWKLGRYRPLAFNKINKEIIDKWLKNNEWDENRVMEELIKPALTSIIQIGGFRSKGFGKVEVSIQDTKDEEYTWSVNP